MQINDARARFFADWLTALREPSDPKDAVRATRAVASLPAEVPLNVAAIDKVGVSDGMRANLLFAWLRRQYPGEVDPALSVGQSLADVLKQLLDGGGADWRRGEVPEFLARFHQAITTIPRGLGPHASERLDGQLLAAAKQDRLVYLGDGPARVALELGDVACTAVREGRAFRLSVDAPVPAAAGLSELAPEARAALRKVLEEAGRELSLGDEGEQLLGALKVLGDAPAQRSSAELERVEAMLRLELGERRAGRTSLETLNSLVASLLHGAEPGPAAEPPPAVAEPAGSHDDDVVPWTGPESTRVIVPAAKDADAGGAAKPRGRPVVAEPAITSELEPDSQATPAQSSEPVPAPRAPQKPAPSAAGTFELLLDIVDRAARGHFDEDQVRTYREACKANGIPVDNQKLHEAEKKAHTYRFDTFLGEIEIAAKRGEWDEDKVSAYRQAAMFLGKKVNQAALDRALDAAAKAQAKGSGR